MNVPENRLETMMNVAIEKAALSHKQVAKEASKTTIEETFKLLGIDVTNFDEIRRFNENMNWVAKYRKVSESIGSKIIVTVTTVVTGGLLVAFWAFLQEHLRK